jgi:two-component system cell cycle response regulator
VVEVREARMAQARSSWRPSARYQSRLVLLHALAERHPDLGDHSDGVAALAAAVARRLGLSDDEIARIRLAADLHDVGKLAIPDAILCKPGPLDEDELDVMRNHTVIGERILSACPALSDAGPLVRASHERWDGRGYPDGLAGRDIPLGARILAVADAFDAIVTERCYSPSQTVAEALDELRRCAGTQFDPAVVREFVALVDAGQGVDDEAALAA